MTIIRRALRVCGSFIACYVGALLLYGALAFAYLHGPVHQLHLNGNPLWFLHHFILLAVPFGREPLRPFWHLAILLLALQIVLVFIAPSQSRRPAFVRALAAHTVACLLLALGGTAWCGSTLSSSILSLPEPQQLRAAAFGFSTLLSLPFGTFFFLCTLDVLFYTGLVAIRCKGERFGSPAWADFLFALAATTAMSMAMVGAGALAGALDAFANVPDDARMGTILRTLTTASSVAMLLGGFLFVVTIGALLCRRPCISAEGSPPSG